MTVVSYVESAFFQHEFAISDAQKDALRARIRELQGRQILAATDDSAIELALDQLEYAINEFRHLRKVFSPGGRETRAHARKRLRQLSTALAQLVKRVETVTELIGDDRYNNLPIVVMRRLAAADATGRVQYVESDCCGDWVLPDPLAWASSKAHLVAAISWARETKEVVDRAERGTKSRGREEGSPDARFSESCLETILNLAQGAARPEQLQAKHLEGWLRLAYEAAEVTPENDIGITAQKLLSMERKRVRGNEGAD